MSDLIDLVNSDPSIISKLSSTQLSSLVESADRSYYLGDASPFSDAIYDSLRERLTSLIGYAPVSRTPITGRKVNLPYYLGSMDKVKPGESALTNWLVQYPGPYVVSTKLDGVSALYTRGKEGTPKLYTRGDGAIGQDISFLLQHLNLPPLGRLNAVRGELIIPKTTFRSKRFAKPGGTGYYENARNTVSGLVNSLEDRYSGEIANAVHFVAYEHIAPTVQQPTLSLQLETLKRVGFEITEYLVVTTLDDAKLSDIYDTFLATSPYEIDGVIAHIDRPYHRNSSDNPEYARAYKKNLDVLTATTTVLGVEWNLSRTKFFKPVLILEPINVDGVTIQRATAYNAKYIVDHRIGPGAIVKIIRSGGVIPKVLEVIQPALEGSMPIAPYKWGATGVDIVLDQLPEDESTPELDQLRQEVRVKSIAYFLATLGIEKMGEKTVEKIYDILKQSNPTKEPTINDFLHLTQLQIRSLGPKTSQMIPQYIQTGLKHATTNTLAAASGLFGRGIGERKLEAITSNIPNFWTRYPLPFQTSLIRSDLLKVGGVAEVTAQLIANNYEKFYRFFLSIRSLLDPLKTVDGPKPFTVDRLAKESGLFNFLTAPQLEQLLSDPTRNVVNAINYDLFLKQLPLFENYVSELEEKYNNMIERRVNRSDLEEEITQEGPYIPTTTTTTTATTATTTTATMPTTVLKPTYLKVMPKNVVLSDLKNKAKYERLIKDLGGTTNSSVSHSTNLVVIGSDTVDSIKKKAADKKGIPVVTLAEFERDYLTPIVDTSDLIQQTVDSTNDSVVNDDVIIEDVERSPALTVQNALDILNEDFSLDDLLLINDMGSSDPRRSQIVKRFREVLEPVVHNIQQRRLILNKLITEKQLVTEKQLIKELKENLTSEQISLILRGDSKDTYRKTLISKMRLILTDNVAPTPIDRIRLLKLAE